MPPRRQPQASTAAKARPRASNASRKRKASHPPDEAIESSTPARVVDAAIATILEEGFYRASSNEIARRSEVTWGVIQYHFGSREVLMLAVLERAASELQRTLSEAKIEGDTLEERLASLAEVVWSYYGRLEFLAYIQVLLNLSHDPTTEEQTRAQMGRNQLHVSHHLPPLLDAALEPDVPRDHPQASALRTFVFAALRGMAIDQGHLEALPRDVPIDPAAHLAQRQMLVEALALQVRAMVGQSPSRRRTQKAGTK